MAFIGRLGGLAGYDSTGETEGTANCWGNGHGMLYTNQFILIRMIIDDDN